MVRVRPVTPQRLAAHVADLIDTTGPGWVRVAVDGAPTADPAGFADALAGPLLERGRATVHVPADGFWKAASLRLERGRTNPDAFYEDWLDVGALTREVLAPCAAGGTGRILPSRWNPVTDRATRAAYRTVPDGGVVVVTGPMLLGAGLDFDRAVLLVQSAAALARQVDPAWAWTLPAYERYEQEVQPALFADLVVRADDPRHPALVEP